MVSSDAATSLLQATGVSLRVAGAATALAVVVGGLLAWRLCGRHGRWTFLIEVLIGLPLVLPPAMLGFYLLTMLGREGPIGGLAHRLLAVDLAFTPIAATLAAAVTGIPISYRAMRVLFDRVDPDLLGAARLDGATDWQVFLRVRLPLAAGGLLAGVLLSFLRALGEFGATLMVAGNIPGRTQTLSLALWGSLLSGNESTAHLMAATLVLLCIPITGLLYLLDQRLHSGMGPLG